MTEQQAAPASTKEMLEKIAMHVNPTQIANDQVSVVKRSMLLSMFQQLMDDKLRDAGASKETVEEYEKKMQELREEYEKKLQDLAVEHSENLQKELAKAREDSSGDSESLEKRLQKEAAAWEGRLLEAQEKYEAQIAELKAQIDVLNEEIARLQEISEDRGRLQGKVKRLTAELQDQMDKIEQSKLALEMIESLKLQVAEAENKTESAVKKVVQYDAMLKQERHKALAELTEKYTAQSKDLLEYQVNDDVFEAVEVLDFDNIEFRMKKTEDSVQSIMEEIRAAGVADDVILEAEILAKQLHDLHEELTDCIAKYSKLLDDMNEGKCNVENFFDLALCFREIELLSSHAKIFPKALAFIKP